MIQSERHKTHVDKQKKTRKERQEIKSGRKKTSTHSARRHGAAGGRYSPYKKHPISDRAQFSGIDRQVIASPADNISETNAEKRQELEYHYKLRHRPQAAPRFNPTPRPH